MIEFVFEVLLQLVFEVLELVFSSGVGKSKRVQLPLWLSIIVYAGFGVLAGFISVLIFPQAFLHGSIARIANLVVTPLLMGVLAGMFAAWRSSGQQGVFLHRFASAYAFALSLALFRFFAANHA